MDKSQEKSVKPKIRVVASRYKQSSINKSSWNIKSSNSTNREKDLNATSICAIRNGNADETSLGKSSEERSLKPKSCGMFSSSRASNLQLSRPPISKNSTVGTSKLLALSASDNESTYAGEGVFSSTLLSDCSMHRPELADISQICVSNKHKNKQKSNSMIFPKDEKIISQKELDVSYMNYLTMAYLDVSAQKKHEADVAEAKNQLIFLAQLLEEKRAKILEEKRMIALVDWYDKLSVLYSVLEAKLLPLLKSASISRCPIEHFYSHLENQLCQINLKNIINDDNQEVQREKFQKAVDEMYGILVQLNDSMQPNTKCYKDIKSLLDELILQMHKSFQCLKKVDKTSSMAIEECSLQLTFDCLKLSVH